MQLAVNKKGKVLVVKPLESRLDASLAVDFKDKMAEYIDQGNDQIVLNISDVDFIDSSGLGALVTSLKLQKDEGGIVICGAKDTIKSMFRLTRMDRVFRIFDYEDEAVDVLSKSKTMPWS